MEWKTVSPTRNDEDDLDSLLHPAQAFAHPNDVVNDADMTLNEKRAILASWASDACAVEAVPSLRRPLGARCRVAFDEVMDALRALDKEARKIGRVAGTHRVLDRTRKNPRSGTPDTGRGQLHS
jgi:hypothetical protein